MVYSEEKDLFSMSIESLKLAINMEAQEMDVIVLLNKIAVEDLSSKDIWYKELIVN